MRKRRRWSKEEKADIVRGFYESGLTAARYAEIIPVNASLLRNWIRLDREAEAVTSTRALIPVRVTPTPPVSQVAFELELREGRQVRILPGFDAATLERLIKTLDQC